MSSQILGCLTQYCRKRKLSILPRTLAWVLLLAFVTQMTRRMILLNSHADVTLPSLITNNELFTSCLKAIAASRFTMAGGVIGLVYTPLVLLVFLSTGGQTYFVLSILDFIVTVIIVVAVALTASYTPLNPQTCQSVTPQSVEPKTILYARLQQEVDAMNGVTECMTTLTYSFIGLAGAILYAIVAATSIVRAVRGTRRQTVDEFHPLTSYILQPPPNISPARDSAAIHIHQYPEQSHPQSAYRSPCRESTHRIRDAYSANSLGSSIFTDTSVMEAPPPPYAEHNEKGTSETIRDPLY